MPYHNSTEKKPIKKEKLKPIKKEKPLNKPRKDLSKMQKDYMKEHSKKHSPEHNKEMIRLMKLGNCIEQSHRMTMKTIGR